jgi:hypothetical protein
MAVQKRQGGPQVGERATGGRPDPCRGHDLLGEGLGGLDLGGRGAWTEDCSTLCPQAIRQAACQGNLGSHDREIDAVHVGCIGNAVEVVGSYGEIMRYL